MRPAPRRARLPTNKRVIATAHFLEQLAISQYALHAGLHLQHITLVWRDLWGHVATQLRTGKVRSRLLVEVQVCSAPVAACCNYVAVPVPQGVLLPSLGSLVMQSGGVCSEYQVPVLHLIGSLAGRLDSECVV